MGTLPDVHVFTQDDHHLALLWRNVFVTAWWGETTVGRLRKIGEVQNEVVRRMPKGFVALALLRSANANLPSEVRTEAEKLSKYPPPQLRAIAQVIHGSGFAAAAIRSVATGMQLLSPLGRPAKVFDSLDKAATWLVPQINEIVDSQRAVTSGGLLRAIRSTISETAPAAAGADVAPW